MSSDWLRDPESVTVERRARGTTCPWIPENDPPVWDHERWEYRVEPHKRTGRMVEAPEEGERYHVPAPHREDWYLVCDWRGCEDELLWLARGLCHYDADSAIAAAKRMPDNAQLGTNGEDER